MYIYINSGHEDTVGDNIVKDKEDGFEDKGQDDEGQDEEEQQQPDFRDEFDDPVPFNRG